MFRKRNGDYYVREEEGRERVGESRWVDNDIRNNSILCFFNTLASAEIISVIMRGNYY